MFDFSQLSDRINYGLKKSGKNQSRLAEECGVKSSSVMDGQVVKPKI